MFYFSHFLSSLHKKNVVECCRVLDVMEDVEREIQRLQSGWQDGNELLHSITKLAMSGHICQTSRHSILLTTSRT